LLPGGSLDSVPEFLAARRDYYDCVLASDRDVLRQVKRFVVTPAARLASS
jgi:hypothetical protein